MRKTFNYRKFNDEVLDTLVVSFGALCDSYMDGKGNTPEYKEANKQFNESFMKECVGAIPHTEFSGLDMLANPMVHKDVFFLHRFNTILAQMLTRATCC